MKGQCVIMNSATWDEFKEVSQREDIGAMFGVPVFVDDDICKAGAMIHTKTAIYSLIKDLPPSEKVEYFNRLCKART